MDPLQILGLMGATALGVLAMLVILRRQRREAEDAAHESPYAASTEGAKRCPKCGMGNLWTDPNCIACRARLPG
jgi:hypothetical protein